MKHSIWTHPWDLAGWEPGEFITGLRTLGLDACNLALSYHATRLVLPTNRCHTVYEDSRGGLHYHPDAARWREHRLQPEPTAHAPAVNRFLRECERTGFPVQGWVVLCHNDYLGEAAPDCTIENACGDLYPYALCPANPDVAAYCATLCAEAAAQPAVASLDVEAASFLGYDHGSVHERTGIPMSGALRWLLSLCFCRHCMAAFGPSAEALRRQVRAAIRDFLDRPRQASAPQEFGEADWARELLNARRKLVVGLLRRIREAVPATPLHLRFSTDLWFCGGKPGLEWGDLDGVVDAATLTYLGTSPTAMAEHLAAQPNPAPLPLTVGFIFCHPDTVTDADFDSRYRAAAAAGAREIAFYNFGIAGAHDLERLARRLPARS